MSAPSPTGGGGVATTLATAATAATLATSAPPCTRGQLVGHCVSVLASFNAGQDSPDIHAERYLVRPGRPLDVDDVVFIEEVFHGCLRYVKLIKVVVNSFFDHHPGVAIRSDAPLLSVFTYLILLRLDELTVAQLWRLVKSQSVIRTCPFLTFLLNEENINNIFKPGWCECYDVNYVENALVGLLVSRLPELEGKLHALQDQLAGRKTHSKANAGIKDVQKKDVTRVEPFNLTKPRPRLIPEPDCIDIDFKALPLPTFDRPVQRVEVALEDIKEKRREETRRLYEGAAPPTLHTTARALEKTAKTHEDFALSSKTPKKSTREKPPKPRAATVEDQNVKLNVAAILREDAMYKKRRGAEAKIIMTYEQELRDASEFFKWQQSVREKDEEARLAEVDRRRQEMMVALGNANAAIHKTKQKKKRMVQEMRQQAKELAQQLKEIEAEELAQQAVQVREIMVDCKEKPKRAKEEVTETKRKRAQEIAEEKERLRKATEDERRREAEKRIDVIRQIRALEKVPVQRVNLFDPTTSSGLGLFDEMSLVELKERLAGLKQANAEACLEKRSQIIKEKQKKTDKISTILGNLSRIRKKASAIGDKRREERKQAELDELGAADQHKLESYVRLTEKLADRREQQRAIQYQLQEEDKRRREERALLQNDRAGMDEKRWLEFEKAADRTAAARQNTLMATEQTRKQLLKRDEANRRQALDDKEARKVMLYKDYKRRLAADSAEAQAQQEYEAAFLKQEVDAMKLTDKARRQKSQDYREHLLGTLQGSFSAKKSPPTNRHTNGVGEV
eukprot:gnl/Hemi2/15208_TR5130_c0_g12_i1.p1 gnl/Hemi2/15208_TR5130_c0_g12~~gnl/Hemi2/15208_TR5130_c0_g12_i1.p1  ORF type:complete len:794 (-),score=206.36 gnl/Hemi2/15208_TR5130_c0_g12_i1:73-2454(-)